MPARSKARRKTAASNVDRLHKAGALKAARRHLSKKHEQALNRLSKAEVNALVKVAKKVGRLKAPRSHTRPWLV